MPDLNSLWRRSFSKAVEKTHPLKVVNESGVNVPLEIIAFWRMVADDRQVSGTLRILPFDEGRPFGEVIEGSPSGGLAVVFVSKDTRITPAIFVRSNGVHEIRHLEQNQRSYLIDEKGREELIRIFLKYDGLPTPDPGFLDRHHDRLPEEIDAYIFEREVAGFDARPFARAVRMAMDGHGRWPNPENYIIPVTRIVAGGER